MPVNLHILTGFNYSRFERTGLDTYRTAVNTKLTDAANSLFDLVLVASWRASPNSNWFMLKMKSRGPFFVHEWDKYYKRFRHQNAASFHGKASWRVCHGASLRNLLQRSHRRMADGSFWPGYVYVVQ